MDDVSPEREADRRRAARRVDRPQEGLVPGADPPVRRRPQVRYSGSPHENPRGPGAPARGGLPALRSSARAASRAAVRRGLPVTPPAQRRPDIADSWDVTPRTATTENGGAGNVEAGNPEDGDIAPNADARGNAARGAVGNADAGSPDTGPAKPTNGRSQLQKDRSAGPGPTFEVRDRVAAIMRRKASGSTSSTPAPGTAVNQDVTTSHAPERTPHRGLYYGTGARAPAAGVVGTDAPTSVASSPVRVTSRPVPVTTPPVRVSPVALANDEISMPRRGRSRHRSSRRRRQLPLWQEVPLLLVIAFVIAVLIRTFLLQAFFIPSGSMEHTLDVGDKVLVNKVVYDVRQPARGEVVVFRGTDRWAPEHKPPPTDLSGRIGRGLGDLVGISQPGEKDFIKRVIGLPGDIVACCDAQGRVTVNGYPLDEPHIFENAPDDVPPSATECRSREFDPLTVPADQIFVMGDHRLVSQDSRCQGPVPIENIVGRAFLVVWPASRWDILEVPETFAKVPRPYANAASGREPYRGDQSS